MTLGHPEGLTIYCQHLCALGFQYINLGGTHSDHSTFCSQILSSLPSVSPERKRYLSRPTPLYCLLMGTLLINSILWGSRAKKERGNNRRTNYSSLSGQRNAYSMVVDSSGSGRRHVWNPRTAKLTSCVTWAIDFTSLGLGFLIC